MISFKHRVKFEKSPKKDEDFQEIWEIGYKIAELMSKRNFSIKDSHDYYGIDLIDMDNRYM